MNIWDSVQRGLEKASQEAARIAKAQRLRTILDNTARQLDTQQGLVIAKAMELYLSGRMPPGDLFAACQELHNLHQHFSQLQSELNQVQQIQNQQNMNNPNTTNVSNIQGTDPGMISSQATQLIPPESQPMSAAYTPSSNQGYPPYDSAMPSFVPPPPPGTVPAEGQQSESSGVMSIVPPPPPLVERNHCPVCHVALVPGNAFCHNCGTPVVFAAESQQPTVRGGTEPATGSGATGNASTPVGEDEPPEVLDEY